MSNVNVLRVGTAGYGVQVFVSDDLKVAKLRKWGDALVEELKGREDLDANEFENHYVQIAPLGSEELFLHIELGYHGPRNKVKDLLVEKLDPQYVSDGSAEASVERDSTGRHVATLVSLDSSNPWPDDVVAQVESVDGVLRATNGSYGSLRFSVTNPADEDAVRNTVAAVAKALKVKLSTEPSKLKIRDDGTSKLIPARDYDSTYAGNGSKALA